MLLRGQFEFGTHDDCRGRLCGVLMVKEQDIFGVPVRGWAQVICSATFLLYLGGVGSALIPCSLHPSGTEVHKAEEGKAKSAGRWPGVCDGRHGVIGPKWSRAGEWEPMTTN